jgi:hypothetical protein
MSMPYNYNSPLPNGTFNGFWIQKTDGDAQVVIDTYTDNPDPNVLINGQPIPEHNVNTQNRCQLFNVVPCKSIGGNP